MRRTLLGVLPAVALLAVVAITSALGTWQLRRGAEKDALQAQRDRARALPPVMVDGAAPDIVSLHGRRVVLVGRFDEARTVFLDNRTRGGVAGFHVLAPLRLDAGGGWVMVLRGWVARDPVDRTRLPGLVALPESVRIEGFAHATLVQPMTLAAEGPPGPSDRIWQRFDGEAYRRWSGLAVSDGVVRQSSGPDDGLARDWIEPGSTAEKHRAYAFQWFAMACLAGGWGLYVAVTRLRRK